MTLAQGYIPNRYIANGSTTVFPYQFKVHDADHLKVYVDGVQVTPFEIDGIGLNDGGNVTFSSPPSADSEILIFRDVPAERTEFDYQTSGDFLAETVDKDFDQIWMVVQQLLSTLENRAVLFPITLDRSNNENSLPAPVENGILYWSNNELKTELLNNLLPDIEGSAPTVTDNGNGTYTIVGSNGQIVIRDGNDGADAPIPTVTDNGNGTYTVDDGSGNSVIVRDGTNGTNGSDGADGAPAPIPTLTDNGDGTYTVNDGTGNTVVLRDGNDGSDGTNGNDGAPAPIPTVTDNGNGTFTVDDGTGNTVIISNGADGNDGADGATPIKGVDYFDGNDGSFVSFIFRSSASVPSTPTGGTFNGSVETFPTGWSDTPVFVQGQVTYISRARYNYDGSDWVKSSWSAPTVHVQQGQDGNDGADGADGLNGNDGNDGTTPVKGVDYFDGNDGSFVSFIYRSSVSVPATPTGGSFDGNSETFPTGWSDNATFVEGQVTYMSRVRYSYDGSAWVKSSWSSPVVHIKQGDQGVRGSKSFYIANRTNWGVTQAVNAIPGDPIENDIVVQFDAATGFSETRYFNGTSPATNESNWVVVDQIVDNVPIIQAGVATPFFVDNGTGYLDAVRIRDGDIELLKINGNAQTVMQVVKVTDGTLAFPPNSFQQINSFNFNHGFPSTINVLIEASGYVRKNGVSSQNSIVTMRLNANSTNYDSISQRSFYINDPVTTQNFSPELYFRVSEVVSIPTGDNPITLSLQSTLHAVDFVDMAIKIVAVKL